MSPAEPVATVAPPAADAPAPIPSVGGRRVVTAEPQATSGQLELPPALTAAGVKARARRIAKSKLPASSRRGAAVRAALLAYRESRRVSREVRDLLAQTGVVTPKAPTYRNWCRRHDADTRQLVAQREASSAAAAPLRVTVCVLSGGDEEAQRALGDTIASVRAQSWQHWSLAVCACEASVPDVSNHGVELHVGDTTITALHHAIEQSDADFLLILDAGDQLAPECVYQIARAAWQDPFVDLVTWDDDLVGREGRHSPRFRPSWSPESLFGVNYLAQSFAIRRRRLRAVGGVRNSYGEAMRWDLLLRAGLDSERVVRVPRVLTHLKQRRDIVDSNGVRVVQEALDARGIPAVAELSAATVRLRWALQSWPKVSVVIPTRHNRAMLSNLLPGLARTDYPSFEVQIVDNGGRSEENDAWYAQHGTGLDLHVQWWTETPFNSSRVNNAGVAPSSGEVLVFLDDGIELPDRGWLKELVGWATLPEIGVAGLQMVRADGRIQHAGAIVGLGGFADHVFEGMPVGSETLLGHTG
jgi:hypothetical protein